MHMKTRITLTIDPGVSHRAKEVARREGVSLSSMVEKMLSEVSGTPPAEPRVSFSQRWRGRMRVDPGTDERSRRLKHKYSIGE